jgi:HK97 family phage major capsid protein
MALKALMLRKKLNDANKQLEALRAKEAELATREAELATSIDEAETEEERSAVEEAVTAFEADKTANDAAKAELEGKISELEEELRAEEAAQDTTPAAPEPAAPAERKDNKKMSKREKFFGMTIQERDAFVAREDVKSFLAEVRTAIKEKRALQNVGLLIPSVMLGLIRENIIEYSKLYKHVNVRPVPGTGRMVIQGAIPEAVWTEMCANLNELDLSFADVEVDGYKVGGYFRVCNATIEDSDIDLAADLIEILGQAIGFALDKAILFGTGTKMPTGILTALKAVSGTPNIVSHAASVTEKALFKALVKDSGLAKGKYSRGTKVWVMNETTYTNLIAEALGFDASGAIVSGINGTMPVIGGVIEVLNFIPDNIIIGGYFDLYLLAERAGTVINTSEHAFWVEDQTGFKGTARYDGKVLVDDAFVAIGINGAAPADATVTFAQDTANA